MNNNIGEAVLVGFFAAAVRDAGSTESSSGGYSGNGSGFVFVAHPVPPAPDASRLMSTPQLPSRRYNA